MADSVHVQSRRVFLQTMFLLAQCVFEFLLNTKSSRVTKSNDCTPVRGIGAKTADAGLFLCFERTDVSNEKTALPKFQCSDCCVHGNVPLWEALESTGGAGVSLD